MLAGPPAADRSPTDTQPIPGPTGTTTADRGLWLRLVASVILTAALLWVFGRRLDAIPHDLSVAPWVVPAYIATLLVYFAARAGRWWFLVRPLAPVPVVQVSTVACAGFLWILALPWRLGEFIRPLLLARTSPVRFTQALGTVVLERVVDGLVVCAMFFVAASILPAEPTLLAIYRACIGVALAFCGALVVLLGLAIWPRVIGRLVQASLGRVLPGLARRLADMAQGLAEGLAALPSATPLLGFLAVTIVYWVVNAAGMWLLATGCGLTLTPLQIVAVLAVMNLALLIPGPPGHVGTFHLGVLTGLGIFLAPDQLANRAATFAFYLYFCQVAVTIVLGVSASIHLGWGWRDTLAALRR